MYLLDRLGRICSFVALAIAAILAISGPKASRAWRASISC